MLGIKSRLLCNNALMGLKSARAAFSRLREKVAEGRMRAIACPVAENDVRFLGPRDVGGRGRIKAMSVAF